MRVIAVAAVAAVAALSLSGCAAFSDDAPTASTDDGLQVVAAFYPLQYVTQRVVGDRADVENLTTPGGEPHDLTLDPRETAYVVQADLLVYEAGFQPAVDDTVEQNAGGTTLDAAAVVGLLPFEEHGGEHGAEDADHHEDDGHDHEGDLDPHFWLDPMRMAELGEAVADSLAEIDPEHAGEFRDNATALREDLVALDGEFRQGLTDCARTTIVVSHDAFGYLDAYGIEVAPIAGLSPSAEPTPAVLAELQRLIEDDGITTVFSERLASTRFVDSLAEDAGVTTAVLDPIEGLTDATAGQDYLSLMRENLAELRKANACG